MEKTVLVIGHRNPDTDSVCSAIAYAYLKQQLGLNAVPARAGKINPETQFVLEHFGVPVPKLVDDLYPRLSDIRLAQPPTVGPDASLRDVGRLFVEYEGLKSYRYWIRKIISSASLLSATWRNVIIMSCQFKIWTTAKQITEVLSIL